MILGYIGVKTNAMWHDKHDVDNLDGTSKTRFQSLIMQVAISTIAPNVDQ
jgi:hypothetical protein